MTAPAGTTPPSAVTGRSVSKGDDTIEIDRAVLGQYETGSLSTSVGKSNGDPTANLLRMNSPFDSSIRRRPPSSGSLCDSALGTSIALMPLFKTYTPPPTAQARHATCEISEPPPHLQSTDPKPGPNTPMDSRCLLIRGTA